MTRIALITCEEEPFLYGDDILFHKDLVAEGFEAKPTIWSDSSSDLSYFDILLIRSVWDYHERPEEFRLWLNNLGNKHVFNPIEILRNNMEKSYLLRLSERGIRIVPTIIFVTCMPAFRDLFEQLDSEEIVVKPLIGASSHDLHRIRRGEAFDLAGYFSRNSAGIIVQPFYPEVMYNGEISLIFFNRKFSHAVRKMPCAGEFRVQDDFGGAFSYIEPPKSLVHAASEVLDHVHGDLLYARVDYLETQSQGTLLIELELLEPVLYLEKAIFRQRFISALRDII